MNWIDVVGLSFTIASIIMIARYLGLFRASFREPLNNSLDAIYVRCGLISWELLIAAKGKEVGIVQGRFILPAAKARASQVGQGKRTIV